MTDPAGADQSDGGAGPVYRRVLLKLSGDAFSSPGEEFGISGQATPVLGI